jgi:hypothetical protein
VRELTPRLGRRLTACAVVPHDARMRLRFLSVAALAAVAGACVHIDYIPLNPPPHPMTPRDPDQVAVFQTNPPDKPYVEVATIEGEGSVTSASVMEKLREEAGRRGCDGLYITGTKDSTQTSGSFGKGGGSVTTTQIRGYRAVCIVYKDVPAEKATPAEKAPPAETAAPAAN